jgi:hypothetical protein
MGFASSSRHGRVAFVIVFFPLIQYLQDLNSDSCFSVDGSRVNQASPCSTDKSVLQLLNLDCCPQVAAFVNRVIS